MRLKQKIIDLIVIKYLYKKYKFKSKKKKNEFLHLKNDKKVLLFCSPTHGNIGDHAIAFASKRFIQTMFPDKLFIEFGITETYQNYYAIKNMINEDDILFFIGGGNMNDVYWYEEWTRRDLVKEFKQNPIISLPQTARFSNSLIGRIEKYRSANTYKQPKKILLLAREEYSYKFMKENFQCNSRLVPDIVLSLGYINNEIINDNDNNSRNGIALCLRDDLEGIFKLYERKELINKIKQLNKKIYFTSTTIEEQISKNKRKEILYDKWKEFKSYELIITDRLHGMIFCAITKTPCIVFPNSDGKIKGTYEKWLKNFPFIHYYDHLEISDLSETINELINIKINNNGFIDTKKEFSSLKKYITDSLHER